MCLKHRKKQKWFSCSHKMRDPETANFILIEMTRKLTRHRTMMRTWPKNTNYRPLSCPQKKSEQIIRLFVLERVIGHLPLPLVFYFLEFLTVQQDLLRLTHCPLNVRVIIYITIFILFILNINNTTNTTEESVYKNLFDNPLKS